jgi:hypothetical protein
MLTAGKVQSDASIDASIDRRICADNAEFGMDGTMCALQHIRSWTQPVRSKKARA